MNVYKFEDDFIAARTLEEATAEYQSLFSAPLTTPGRQLTDAELDTLTVRLTDGHDAYTGETQTMREHLTEQMRDPGRDKDAFYLCGED